MKTTIYLFGFIFLVLVSCEKDNLQESIQQKNHPKLSGKIISGKEAFKNTIVKSRLEALLSNKKETHYRTIDSNLGFSIDTTEVSVIESEAFTNYTFEASRDSFDETKLENYVLNIFPDGTYNQFLVTYQINNINTIDLTGTTIELIEDDGLLFRDDTCPQAYEIVEWDADAGECVDYMCTAGGGHMPGEDCNGDPDQQPYRECTGAWVVTGCASSSGGGGVTTNNNGNVTGGNSTTTTGTSGLATTTTAITPKASPQSLLKFRLGITNLSDAAIDWINNPLNGLVVGAINHNLNNGTITEEFAIEAIEALADGGDVDLDNGVILEHSFSSNPKLKCVYDKLTEDNSSLFKETIGSFIENPDIQLVFKVGNCNNTDTACTDDSSLAETGCITIIIEDVEMSPLELAGTILHESIHAELAKFVYQFQSGLDINDRPYLFQLYKFYRESGVPEHHLDHPYMTIKYINPMANVLREFDNNSYPIDYYKSIAWDGLRNWDVNNVLTEPMEDIYTEYRSIVIENSEVCN